MLEMQNTDHSDRHRREIDPFLPDVPAAEQASIEAITKWLSVLSVPFSVE
jgi:hypothetical protein